MKKVFLVFAIMIASVISAQSVGEVPLKDIKSKYLLVMGSQKVFKKQINIWVDFGQKQKLFSSGKKTTLFDENGKRLGLNSMVDALNFFDKYGYEFVNAYTVTKGGSDVYHYLLKKKN